MRARAARAAFALAALAVAAALALLLLARLATPDAEESRTPARNAEPAGAAKPVVSGGRSPSSERDTRASTRRHEVGANEDLAPGERPRDAGRWFKRATQTLARRFLVALLAAEAGDRTRMVLAELETTARPRLARVLTEEPVRPVRGSTPPPGELVALDRLPGVRPGRVELLATVRRGRATTGLILTLERDRRRWLVAALR